MRDMAAAEHSQHWLFASTISSSTAYHHQQSQLLSSSYSTTNNITSNIGSQRSVYPRINHMTMFTQVQEIIDNTLAITNAILLLQQKKMK